MKKALVLFAWITAAGCAVGPDFRAPVAPAVMTYTEKPLPLETVSAPGVSGSAQRFANGRDIPDEWWGLFRSEPLDRLIRQALKESPTLAAAEAALRRARENLRARGGTVTYPSVDGTLGVSRQRNTGASFGQPNADAGAFTLFNASVNVSYTLDLFGGGRRELEGLQAEVDYKRFLLEGAHLALTSNIVTAAIQETSLRAQIKANHDIVDMYQKQLDIIRTKYELGGASRSDVLVQQTQLAQTQASLPPLEKELEKTRHQLATYVGRFPGEGGLPEFQLEGMELPRELPVSVPSALVRRRPDVRASEELLHAASAGIGVATANLFPRITLTGGLGTSALRTEDLFSNGTSLWSLGTGLLQPLFHGGELTARRRAAIAAYEQALAEYRDTVLHSFRNVADSLRFLEYDALTLRAQADAEASARDSLDLTRKQYRLGAVNYITLLIAQRQYHQARVFLIQARAARFADTAALFQSLGGGWWNRDSKGATDPSEINP